VNLRRNSHMLRMRGAVLTLSAMLFSTVTVAATLNADVDRKTLYQDEFVLFKLSLINSETRLRAEGEAPNVDLTLLSGDFELGIPQATHNYNVFRNRGRATSAVSVALFPKRSGRLIIPSFTVDGLRSKPITLEVAPPKVDKTPAVFSRSGVTRQEVWSREPTLAYLDLYHRVELKEARLGGKIETTPLQVQLSKLPPTERQITIDGMSYAVTRSLWSITPLDDRHVTVDFPDIWIETRNGDKIRLPFTSSRIEVKPLPEGVPAQILMGKPTLSQRLDGETFRVNEPIPWEITLSAPVDINQLPDTLPVSGISPRIKLYLEKAMRTAGDTGGADKPQSSAVYHGYIIPLASGKISTPDIRIPYFDTRSGFVTILELKGEVLTIGEAIVETMQDTLSPAGATLPLRAAPLDGGDAWTWQVISALLTLLWLSTLGLWWWRGRAAENGEATVTGRDTSPGSNAPPLIALLLAALQSTTLEQGLQKWEKRHGRDENLRGIIAELQRYYYGARKTGDEGNLRQKTVETANRIRTASCESCSKPDADPWSPRAFLRRLE